ncbi:hypothetical protein IAT38_003804 [Cryptococcus sp. DSM 104549]
MSRPQVAEFVDAFFKRSLFQEDDALATSVLADELSEDAQIVINGNTLPAELFRTVISSQFRGLHTATVTSIQDLNIATTNPEGTAGVVGQFSKYETKTKEGGVVVKQSATTIVKVEEREGKKVVTGIWEAQTEEQ